MSWKTWGIEQPPEGELVLVDFGDFRPYGLRMVTENGLYDENEFLDDSGEDPVRWHPIPEG